MECLLGRLEARLELLSSAPQAAPKIASSFGTPPPGLLAIDLPGYGPVHLPEGLAGESVADAVDFYVATLEALLAAHLGSEPVYVVAHSYGSFFALHHAVLHLCCSLSSPHAYLRYDTYRIVSYLPLPHAYLRHPSSLPVSSRILRPPPCPRVSRCVTRSA